MSKEKEYLSLKELFFIFSLLFFVVTACCSAFAAKKKMGRAEVCFKNVAIRSVGALDRACVLTTKGTPTVSDFFAKVGVDEKIEYAYTIFDKTLQHSQTIVIPIKKSIAFFVSGDVQEEKVLYVEHPMTYSEIREKMQFTKTSDMGVFSRRKRMIGDTEIVEIPSTTRR